MGGICLIRVGGCCVVVSPGRVFATFFVGMTIGFFSNVFIYLNAARWSGAC
jgi:hypothetical protein